MKLLGKELKVVATSNWEGSFPSDQVQYFIQVVLSLLPKYPYDMFVVEHKEGKLQVRLAGYPLVEEGHNGLDETTVIYMAETKPFKTFWAKTDEFDEGYVTTILFPEDY